MIRLVSVSVAVSLFTVAGAADAVTPLAAAPLGEGQAFAQAVPKQRPRVRGRQHNIKVDSSPQQAAVYWDAGPLSTPKDFGIAGYTPITLKVPRGKVKLIVELRGFKPQEREIDVVKSQTVTFTMEKAPQPGRLDLRSGADRSGDGAEAFIDGVMRGTVPNNFELLAGRHQLEVKKAGYKTLSDWIDIGEDERRTRDVSLERAEIAGGSLMVTSDAGGEVWIDGVRRDNAPAMIANLSPGDHVVEVRKDGAPPWRQSITIVSGQQAKVAANLAVDTGSTLRVISSEPDVTVFVDGDDKGRAPITIKDVKPGQHIVDGRKPKFKGMAQTIKVSPGEQAIVELKMTPATPDRANATLKVQSTVPNAEVFVDGSSLGRAPVDRTDLEPGKHYVVVHKDGFTDFKREVILIENQPVALVADLSATGSVRVLSTPEGADVRVDGELVGKTPLARDGIGAGDHIIEFRLKGYFDHKQSIKVDGGKEKVFSVDLKVLPSGPSPEQQARRKQGMSSFGARVNPVGGVTADVGVGFPYFFMARLTVGAFAVKPLGLDLGVEFQTFFQIASLAFHARLQLLEVGPLSMAVRGDVGAGTGTNGRDTYFTNVMGIASLAFSNVATFSGTVRFSGWTDRFCPTPTQRSNGVEAEKYCDDATTWPGMFDGKDPNSNRFSGSRVYAGIGATASLDKLVSLYFQLEFLPFPSSFSYTQRPAFQDKYNSAMLDKDPFVYGTAGLTLKF